MKKTMKIELPIGLWIVLPILFFLMFFLAVLSFDPPSFPSDQIWQQFSTDNPDIVLVVYRNNVIPVDIRERTVEWLLPLSSSISQFSSRKDMTPESIAKQKDVDNTTLVIQMEISNDKPRKN